MYEENEKKSIPRTVLTFLFLFLFIFIMSSFIINSCRMSDHEIADDVIFDTKTKDAYNSDKENFTVRVYNIEKRFEAVEGNQLMQLKYFYYIPSTNQMQLTVKYNTSYAATPTNDSIPFELLLKDQSGKTYNDYFYECAEKNGYGYIRVCWNEVEFLDKSEYTLLINQNKDGKMVSRGAFLMQKPSTAYEEIKLTKKNAPSIFRNH